MNRKLIVSLGILFILTLLIIIKRCDSGSGVPDPGRLKTAADQINVKAEGYSLSLVKNNDKWIISEKGYPADAELVSDLEKKVSEIKLLDLISEKGYYDKYDLTEEKGVLVTVSSGGKELRRIMIGKQGLTGNQIYVRLDDSKEVYLASGFTAAEFKPEAETLRDKKIFEITGDSVESFSITYSGREYSFLRTEEKNTEAVEKDGEGKTSGTSAAVWSCRGYESIKIDSSMINNILFSFSPLRASSFPEKPVTGNVLCTVKLKSGGKVYELNIFSKKENEMYYASSPSSPYIFMLGGWQTEKYFIKSIKDLEKKG